MEDILRKLISFPTITGDEQAGHQALDYISSFLLKRGMHVEWFQSNGHESLVATTRPGQKQPRVMLAAHLDVVPGPDGLFELRIEDDKYYGRGVLDMKCAIAAYLQIVENLQDKLEDYDFGIMITTDEETGGTDGTLKLIEEGYRPKVCVLPDGGDNWQIQLTSKGFLYLKFSAQGKTAHGSRPWLGQNAILPLVKTIEEVYALFPDTGPRTNTCNLGKFQGGDAVNQVADHAEAFMDIRVTADSEKDWILPMLEKICARHDVELAVLLNGAATNFSLDNPFVAPFVKAITDVTGVEVKGSHTLGANDTRYLAPYDIPCISFYPTGGGHHGPNEWVDVQAANQLVEVLERYLAGIASVSSEARTLAETN